MLQFFNYKSCLSCCLSLLLSFSWVAAQDIIIKKDGAEIPCKVLELDPPKIKYRPSNHTDGPIRTLYYKEVASIKYGNGTQELLEQPTTVKNNSMEQVVEEEKNEILLLYPEAKPWNLGVGATTVVSFENFVGPKIAVGYTYQPATFRLQAEGFLGVPIGENAADAELLYAANLNLQYVFSLNKGVLKIAPEVGAGIWYQYNNVVYTTPFMMLLAGANVDIKVKEWLSIRINPRYRNNFARNETNQFSAFEGHVGVCFLLGKYHF